MNALRISVTMAISRIREAKNIMVQSVVAGCQHGSARVAPQDRRVMDIFFDVSGFDDRLSETGFERCVMASVAGLSEADLARVFKSQMELSTGQVAAFADLLGSKAAAVANHAGVSAPALAGLSRQGFRILDLDVRVAAREAEFALPRRD